MREKARHQILERFFAELKELIKALLERLMLEERELCLKDHPTKQAFDSECDMAWG